MIKRILVTDACGGIGTSIVKELCINGFHVIATDHPNAEMNNNIKKYAELYVPIDFIELLESGSDGVRVF